MSRRLVWISAGAASAVAAKLDIASHPDAERVLAYTNPGSEHPDNVRFLADLERWLQSPIARLAVSGTPTPGRYGRNVDT